MKVGIVAPVETSSITDLLGDAAAHAPPGYPGAPFVGTLTRSLLARGHQVSLYTTDSSLLPTQNKPIVVHGERVTVYYCPSRQRSFSPQNGRLGRMVDFFRFERQGLVNAIQQDCPDVVHGHWAYEFAWAAMDSRRPHIITFHDAPLKILRHMPNLYRLGRYLMSRRTINSSCLKTTVSPYMQQELLQWAGCTTELVANPIDSTWFSAALAPQERDLSKPKIAMIINGWGKRKNPEPAFRAFSRVCALIPASELHVFGADFGLHEKAYLWCEKNNLGHNVLFHGRVPYVELKQKLAEMTLLVHPALEESFGMTLAEAMALAVPVIGGADSGAVPWVCEGCKAGTLVDVCDEKAIADAMLQLLADPAKYNEMALYAQQSAKARFSAMVVAEDYEKYYLQAVHGN